VDRELQPHTVKRNLSLEGPILVATFTTLTIRLARLSLNAFLENVELVIRTLEEFGDHAASVTPSEGRINVDPPTATPTVAVA